eukprot:SAG22_NODE_6454_length_853_cov_0.604775_2_plen_110_part_00
MKLDEGMECADGHFLCSPCLSAYVHAACGTGGDVVEEVTNANGITSARGTLPCPFLKSSRFSSATCSASCLSGKAPPVLPQLLRAFSPLVGTRSAEVLALFVQSRSCSS